MLNMKRNILFSSIFRIALLFCLFAIFSNFCYSQIITFSAKSLKTSSKVKLDSIKIINLRTNQIVTLKQDTTLNLLAFTVIHEDNNKNPDEFSIMTIYSFSENEVPRVKINLPAGSNLYISVFNSYGVLITKYEI